MTWRHLCSSCWISTVPILSPTLFQEYRWTKRSASQPMSFVSVCMHARFSQYILCCNISFSTLCSWHSGRRIRWPGTCVDITCWLSISPSDNLLFVQRIVSTAFASLGILLAVLLVVTVIVCIYRKRKVKTYYRQWAFSMARRYWHNYEHVHHFLNENSIRPKE